MNECQQVGKYTQLDHPMQIQAIFGSLGTYIPVKSFPTEIILPLLMLTHMSIPDMGHSQLLPSILYLFFPWRTFDLQGKKLLCNSA